MIFSKIFNFLTFNYAAQKFLKLFLIFFFREKIYKFKNLIFKKKSNLSFNKKKNNGWSIVFLTLTLNKKNFNNILLYQKKFKNLKYEIIVICNSSEIKISDKRIKIINLNSSKYTIGFKRNLGISQSNYINIFMTLDYTFPKKINLKKLNQEIKKNDVICPRIMTIDKKRYLDWMYLDYPGVGKSFASYESLNLKYMYFHGTAYIFKKKFIIDNLFSNFLDHKEGEDVMWSLKIRNRCKVRSSINMILGVRRMSSENSVLNNAYFIENNNKLKYIKKYEN